MESMYKSIIRKYCDHPTSYMSIVIKLLSMHWKRDENTIVVKNESVA